MRVMQQISFGLFILLLVVLSGPSSASTSYEYDETGRLMRVHHSSGWHVMYAYDAAGNRTQRIVTDDAPPVAGDDTISVNAGVDYEFDPRTNDSDPDNGTLTITAKTDGSQGTVSIINNGT